ncbi:hypothetical protein FOMPIDRAFT_115830 [Fomitopsis schrenkii]|uniref:Uncharacterized protein n=1 Tax=Fomitopsis schrenkii TaxID=2126942 RepID=S8EE15_FOMSC|nr:hypothetical protein FOMPIDRAFT_115830 [Fomitopsis schrenkii]
MFLTWNWNTCTSTTTTQNNLNTVPPRQRDDTTSPSRARSNAARLPVWRTIMDIFVESAPVQGEGGEGTTWVVVVSPPRRITRGLIIRIRSNLNEYGSGRLSKVTRLTRHWVSFKVHGITPLTSIRVPIPWAQLSQVEQFEHLTRYAELSPTPVIGHVFRHTRDDRLGTVNPYRFEVDSADSYLRRQLQLRDARGTDRRIRWETTPPAPGEGEGSHV